jgi:hypothetical protein
MTANINCWTLTKFGEMRMFNLKRLNTIMSDAFLAVEYCIYNSSIYKEFLAEREEILKHKWLESEKKGYDIGYSAALIDWIIKHRTKWRKSKNNEI